MFSLHYIAAEELAIEGKRRLDMSGTPHSVFGYVQKESVNLTLDLEGNRITGNVLGGEVFYIPQTCDWTMHNCFTRSTHVTLIRFQCEWSLENGLFNKRNAPSLFKDRRLVHFRMPRLRQWMEDFKRSGTSQTPEQYFQLQSHLYAIASACFAARKKPKNTDGDLWDYVEQSKSYMQSNYETDMDMEELARGSGVSSSRFYQAFRKQVGFSPLKFMTTARLNASLGLLSEAESLSVMDVAHSVGYPDEYYFSRLFKKQMGITPTDYAARAKKRIANLAPVFLGDLSVLGITPEVSLERGWSLQPEPYIETIRRSRPELILTHPLPPDLYRTLSEIAPVAMIHWKGYSWKNRLMDIGDMLGLSSVAARWLRHFEQKVDNARFHIRGCMGNQPFLVVSAWKDHFRVFGMQMKKMKDLFYDDLQVTPPTPAQEISFLDVESLHDVAALDCENVLFLVRSTLPEAFCYELEEEWGRLKRNKHCILLRHDDPLFYNAAIHETLVDQMVSQLIQYGRAMRKSPC